LWRRSSADDLADASPVGAEIVEARLLREENVTPKDASFLPGAYVRRRTDIGG
jgi:hypothetical protein